MTRLTASFALALGTLTALGCTASNQGGGGYYRGPSATSYTTAASPSVQRAPAVAPGAWVSGEVTASASGDVDSAVRSAAPMQESVAEGGGGEGPAPSTSAAPPPPSWRPGLATQWGENRRSNVQFTSFERASNSPFETAMIRYNDASGSMAQLNHHVSNGGGSRWFGAYHDGIRISLRDDNGEPLPGYSSGDQMFVVGRPGQRYTISLENNTPQRFEALVSVDGLDVVHGRPASFGIRGYIIPAHSHIEIDGWRRSQSTVAAFRFGAVADSYAADRGDARNVGVVGVALFTEAGVVYNWTGDDEVELRARANPFPGGFAEPPRNRAIY